MPTPQGMVIYKGEQFFIPFDVKIGNDLVTPENVDGVRIKVGDRLCQWPDGELEYDSTESAWMYWLTEAQSLELMAGSRLAQVAVKIGDNILKTDTLGITVKDTIIKERWR